MRILRAALAALLLLLVPAEALASASAPVGIGNASGTTSFAITTTGAAPSGSLIVVAVAVGTNGVAVTSVADSAGNCSGAYTALDNTPVASRPTAAVFYCPNVGLASGQTITVTVPSTDVAAATAFYISGMTATPADVHAKQVNGASGTASTATTTGTLAQAYEVMIGVTALHGGSGGTFSPGAPFTKIDATTGSNGGIMAAYQMACSTSSASWTSSWTTSQAWMADVVTFKVTSGDAPCGSKTKASLVLQNGLENAENSSKANAYFVLGPPEEKMSKTNGYELLNYGAENAANASKTNAYFVLQYNSEMSKTNAYFVLGPKKPSGGFFHAFPP